LIVFHNFSGVRSTRKRHHTGVAVYSVPYLIIFPIDMSIQN
jgi:hypothetical protein